MKLSKHATFYYDGIPEPCCIITIADKRIIAKNLLTGVAFIAEPKKIDVRPLYSRRMMKYIRTYISKHKTPPTRKKIMEKLWLSPVTVCNAFKSASPEIKVIYSKKDA